MAGAVVHYLYFKICADRGGYTDFVHRAQLPLNRRGGADSQAIIGLGAPLLFFLHNRVIILLLYIENRSMKLAVAYIEGCGSSNQTFYYEGGYGMKQFTLCTRCKFRYVTQRAKESFTQEKMAGEAMLCLHCIGELTGKIIDQSGSLVDPHEVEQSNRQQHIPRSSIEACRPCMKKRGQ